MRCRRRIDAGGLGTHFGPADALVQGLSLESLERLNPHAWIHEDVVYLGGTNDRRLGRHYRRGHQECPEYRRNDPGTSKCLMQHDSLLSGHDCSALYSRAVQRFTNAFLALTLAIVLQSPARSAPDALDTFLRSRAPQGRGGRGNVALPDGTGKAQVEGYCSTCHQLGNIVNSGGYTREGWQQLIATMIALPKEQGDVVVEYLAKNFPEQPKPAPVLLAGDTKVAFKEWNLPTLGSRPHDPLATPDGAIWYTGMFANVMGRVDPRTGQIKDTAQDAAVGPARPDGRQGRQDLVHRELEGLHRQAGPRDGRDHRVQASRGGPRSAHTAVR